MNLSIIIACCNDTVELNETIKSIRATAGNRVEIVVVDDCSGCPVWLDDKSEPIQLISNRLRCGVGPSRHIGALSATGDWLMFTDSHMRFPPGWLEEITWKIESGTPNTLWCSTCLQLDSEHMDLNNPVTEYHGATYNLYGPDRHIPNRNQILECVWLDREHDPNDGDEILAVMGAGYFINKNWFLHIDPLSKLRSWGGDEIMLSMKTWLARGEVRMAKTVRVGHKFLLKNEPKMFNPPRGHTLWNKALAAWSLFPKEMAEFFEQKLITDGTKEERFDRDACKAMIKSDWHIIAGEIANNRGMFLGTRELLDKFGIQSPV